MKAIVLDGPNALRLGDASEPGSPGPGEAVVRVLKVGICGTDLHAFQGRQAFFAFPRVLGHELAVEVLDVGADSEGLDPGDVCTVIPYLSCGTCIACRRGKTNCCTTMRVLGVHVDGGMRERIALPAALLLKVDDVPADALALVERLAVGAHAVERARIGPDETALVIGLGPIGLGTLAFARERAARVLAVDISDARLEFARGLDLAEVVDGRDAPLARIRHLLGGSAGEELPTVVFDATGSSRSMMAALDYVPNGGRLVFVGHTVDELSFSNPELHRREIAILCSRNATRDDFVRVLASLRSGRLDVGPWITHRASPEGLVRDFPSWLDAETGVVKAMLEF